MKREHGHFLSTLGLGKSILRDRKREEGLTLIEVLIVVTILAVILAIVIPSYASSTKRAQTKLCFSTQIMVEAQIELYRLDNKVTFANTDNPTEDIFMRLKNEGYLRELPTCPAGGAFKWKDGKLICSEHGHHDQETTVSGTSAEHPSDYRYNEDEPS